MRSQTTLVATASVLLISLVGAYQPPLCARRAHVRSRSAVIRLADDDDSSDALVPSGDMDMLRARIQKIQENGGALATPAQKFFDMAMAKPPQVLMQEFFLSRSPNVAKAMQEAVVSLLGALPPLEFDTQVTATGDKLAALMLQLQMTGYMLRNAEYVITMRKLLGLKTRSEAEYREAFDRIDLDKSGYIEVSEVEELLSGVYPDGVPPFEVTAFVELFDTDRDGRISWVEFAAALGAVDAGEGDDGAAAAMLTPLLGGAPEVDVPSPEVNGTVTVELDDGGIVEMDAAVYMAQLKDEALALRQELQSAQLTKQEEESQLAASLSAYVSSLPEEQLQLLTAGISEDVVTAMRQIVTYILRAPSGDGPLAPDAEVVLEQQKLQQLCLYQLVLGYTLREAEAKGEAGESIGR